VLAYGIACLGSLIVYKASREKASSMGKLFATAPLAAIAARGSSQLGLVFGRFLRIPDPLFEIPEDPATALLPPASTRMSEFTTGRFEPFSPDLTAAFFNHKFD
jgi:hypothetical protein